MRPTGRAASRTIRQEENDIRITGAFLLIALIASGCGGPKAQPVVAKPNPPKQVTKMGAEIEGGDGTWYSPADDQHPLWYLKWQSATVEAENDVPVVSSMSGVSGEIFESDGTKSFRADRAVADKNSNVLTLTGDVSVYAPKQRANLKCKKLVYNAVRKTFLGSGNVSLTSPTVTLTGVPEAESDSNFNQVASPEMFKEGHATHS